MEFVGQSIAKNIKHRECRQEEYSSGQPNVKHNSLVNLSEVLVLLVSDEGQHQVTSMLRIFEGVCLVAYTFNILSILMKQFYCCIISTFKYHVFAPMGRFQLELICLYFPPSFHLTVIHLTFNFIFIEYPLTRGSTQPLEDNWVAT